MEIHASSRFDDGRAVGYDFIPVSPSSEQTESTSIETTDKDVPHDEENTRTSELFIAAMESTLDTAASRPATSYCEGNALSGSMEGTFRTEIQSS